MQRSEAILAVDAERSGRQLAWVAGELDDPLCMNRFASTGETADPCGVVRFERYADDAVVHCVTERQARHLVAAIGDRMEQVGLRLHPDKTKIVYCKDDRRRLDYGQTAFTFLGFTFRTRTARGKSGRLFASFQPAISNDARNKISGQASAGVVNARCALVLRSCAISVYSRRSGGCAASTQACLTGPVPVTAMTAGSAAPGNAPS